MHSCVPYMCSETLYFDVACCGSSSGDDRPLSMPRDRPGTSPRDVQRHSTWLDRTLACRSVLSLPFTSLNTTTVTMPPRPSLEKLLPPILNLLHATPPNPYSAHQKALTTTARLVRNGQGALACEILFNVARELLKAGETASGAELGVRMIEIMHEGGVKVDDKNRGES